MLVSVIIPAYNCEGTLQNTVECLLLSGLKDYEILLIDDGSADKTPELCDSLSETYENVLSIHQVNSGVSGARNLGIRMAKGDYILFFDSDDAVDPSALSDIESILEENTPDMLLFGMSFDYYANGKLYRRDEMVCDQTGLYDRQQWQPWISYLFQCNYLSPVWNKLIRRELIEKEGIRFAETMHLMEDFLFSVQCLDRCERIYLLSQAIYRYRQPEDEGNAERRLKRIPNLVDYMEHFSCLSSEWAGITASVYYMLLRQKVRASSAEEIAAIAEDHKSSVYKPQTEQDRWLDEQLSSGNCWGLYYRNLKSRVRHKLAVFAKSYGLYKRQ